MQLKGQTAICLACGDVHVDGECRATTTEEWRADED